MDKKLDEILDELAYMSTTVVEIGKDEFAREGTKGGLVDCVALR